MPDEPDDKPDDTRVKDLDEAQLMRWFGLPSIAQVEDGERAPAKPAENPDVAAVRERRQKVLAEIDPGFLEALRRRATPPDDLVRLPPPLPSRVDPGMAFCDYSMVEGRAQIAEPREYERPEDIEDQLKDSTPQALLRDLHRAESEFEKLFDVVDMAAEQRVDVVAEVAAAMKTSWKLELVHDSAAELRTVFDELRADRARRWADVPTIANLPNRRVTE